MILNRTSAPVADLVSLADAKAHLRVDHTDEDTLIQAYIDAATATLDGPHGLVGKALVQQTWAATCAPLTGRTAFAAPVTPLLSIVSVSYYDRDNAGQSIDVNDLTVLGEEDMAYIVPDIGTNWPAMYARPDAMTVTWTAGYGATAADVPANIVQAAKFLVAIWHMHRAAPEREERLPPAVEALVGVSRRGWIGA